MVLAQSCNISDSLIEIQRLWLTSLSVVAVAAELG
jgi:hypothetical protein